MEFVFRFLVFFLEKEDSLSLSLSLSFPFLSPHLLSCLLLLLSSLLATEIISVARGVISPFLSSFSLSLPLLLLFSLALFLSLSRSLSLSLSFPSLSRREFHRELLSLPPLSQCPSYHLPSSSPFPSLSLSLSLSSIPLSCNEFLLPLHDSRRDNFFCHQEREMREERIEWKRERESENN